MTPATTAAAAAPTAVAPDLRLAPAICTIIAEPVLDAVTGPALRARILEAGELGYRVCVDLTETTEMDAAGLAAIVGPRRRLRALGLDLVLRNATSPGVLRTLSVTRFAPLFDLGEPEGPYA